MKMIIWTFSLSVVALLLSCSDPTGEVEAVGPENMTWAKVGYADNDTFDSFLQGLLNGKEPRVAIFTQNSYEGSGRPIPKLDRRLQAWIQLWIDANPKKAPKLIDATPIISALKEVSPGVVKCNFDLGDFDPDETTEVILKKVEQWAIDGTTAVVDYANEKMVQLKRKSRLKHYYISFSSIDGKAVIFLSREKMRFDE